MRLVFLILVLLVPALGSSGQSVLRDEVEIGGMYLNYDSGISDWKSLVVRTQFVRGPRYLVRCFRGSSHAVLAEAWCTHALARAIRPVDGPSRSHQQR